MAGISAFLERDGVPLSIEKKVIENRKIKQEASMRFSWLVVGNCIEVIYI